MRLDQTETGEGGGQMTGGAVADWSTQLVTHARTGLDSGGRTGGIGEGIACAVGAVVNQVGWDPGQAAPDAPLPKAPKTSMTMGTWGMMSQMAAVDGCDPQRRDLA